MVIYTGGTIGMVNSIEDNTLVPGSVNNIKEFIHSECLQDHTEINVIATKAIIDSSNYQLVYYQELSSLIKKSYHIYDGFLVLMGTDTMAYVASLLAYCIEGLNKPIVFTGGQLPLFVNASDSRHNLKEALIGLSNQQFPKEVGVYFYKKWHRAVNVVKLATTDYDAYGTPNLKNTELILEKEEVEITTDLQGNISIFKFIPWQSLEVLKLILDSNLLDGLILEVYGAGNMPVFDAILVQKFQQSIKKGLKVVVISQCLKGEIHVGKYQTSLAAKQLNFINGANLSVESASAKLLFAITKKMNIQQIHHFFNISVRGE